MSPGCEKGKVKLKGEQESASALYSRARLPAGLPASPWASCLLPRLSYTLPSHPLKSAPPGASKPVKARVLVCSSFSNPRCSRCTFET
jgi:hypothetical protein